VNAIAPGSGAALTLARLAPNGCAYRWSMSSRGQPTSGPDQHLADSGEASGPDARRRIRKRARGRFRSLPLFWRVFVADAVVLGTATLLLAIAPVTVSVPIAFDQLLILLAGLMTILAINSAFLRHTLQPLQSLIHIMDRIDALEPGRRVEFPDAGSDVRRLAAAFNAMLDRLEAEQRASTQMALSVQEGERQRIARELHDEVGQTLTAMLLQIESFFAAAPDSLRDDLDELRETARSGAEDVRRIAQRLRPEALEELGLPSALLALTDLFARQTGLRVARTVEQDLPLTAQDELVIYRVAQEALTNIARHAHATSAELTLSRADDDAVVLVVRDDGVGFDVDRRGSSYGIRGMRERAMLIGATMRVTSGPRSGTEVTVRLPPRD
jgi:two-component system sensor histidine kinase UhpB